MTGMKTEKTQYLCGKLAYSQDFEIVLAFWSDEIKESNDSYLCPSNYILVGEEHKGDENGKTMYQCAMPVYRKLPVLIGPIQWSDGIKEAGSSYTCPSNQVIVGRQHSGDENGKTKYACAPLIYEDSYLTNSPKKWSSEEKEAGR